MHPYLPQPNLIQFCKKNEIHVSSLAPFGLRSPPPGRTPTISHPKYLDTDPQVSEIAQKHNLTGHQLILSWLIQNGVSVTIPAFKTEYLLENTKVINLPKGDIEAINKIGAQDTLRYFNFSDFGKVFDD